jgi:hypothetical protein
LAESFYGHSLKNNKRILFSQHKSKIHEKNTYDKWSTGSYNRDNDVYFFGAGDAALNIRAVAGVIILFRFWHDTGLVIYNKSFK